MLGGGWGRLGAAGGGWRQGGRAAEEEAAGDFGLNIISPNYFLVRHSSAGALCGCRGGRG